MNLQSIIGFLTSPLGFIILVGVFSTVTRLLKSAQEQQAKKRELQKFRDAQRDSLRTGHKVETTQETSVDIAGDQVATWDQKQDLRKQRIEKLRQQRIEQLNKIRERRSAGTSGQQNAQSGTTQSAPQQPVQPSRQPQATRTARSPQQQSRPQPVRSTPQQPQQRRRSRPPVIPATQTNQYQSVASADTPHTKLGKTLDRNKTIESGSIVSTSESHSKSSKSFIVKNLRQSIIAKEILGPPVAMRSVDSDAASIR
jgi:hypothetical protein